MTAPEVTRWLEDEIDPVAEPFEQARAAGWQPVPQIAIGGTDVGLMRFGEQYVDVLTLPRFGLATVVRMFGAIDPDRPRLTVELWRYQVSVEAALSWAISGKALTTNSTSRRPEDDQPHRF